MYSLWCPIKTFSDYVETDVTDGQRLINILVRIQPTHRFISCHPCGIIGSLAPVTRGSPRNHLALWPIVAPVSRSAHNSTDLVTVSAKRSVEPITEEFSKSC